MDHVTREEALGRMAFRMVQEGMTDALSAQWFRRAQKFEDARPRPGDFNGRATPADLEARDKRCAGAALACRRHSALLASGSRPDYLDAEIFEVLGLAA